GIGPALATALVARVPNPKAFRSGRNFSAWVGLVPKQHSSGGKDRLGGVTKQGDRLLRSLFAAGALAVIRYAKIYGTEHRPWLTALLARRPTKVAAIALAFGMSDHNIAVGHRKGTCPVRSQGLRVRTSS